MRLLKRPSAYLLALFCLLLLTVAFRPAMTETYGMTGQVQERPGTQTGTTVEQEYNNATGQTYPVYTYHFSDGSHTYAASTQRVLGAGTEPGQAVRLGFVRDVFVSVDGVFVFQMGFLQAVALIATCLLPAGVLYLWAKERRQPEDFVVSPGKALGIAALAGVVVLAPALLAGWSSMYFEDEGLAWWPEAFLALGLCTGLVAARNVLRVTS
jgi:hypothetical protein